jgi:CheY-like chemotaxis protein
MEALGTLSGGIAHDFNNILSSTIGFTELALDEVKKGSAVETYLREILKAEIRATDLVSQILTYSRYTKREMKQVKIKSIAKEALKLLSVSLPSTIKIQKNIKSETVMWGDPTHFHQIFMNLCTNAAHAMQEMGGVLEIDLIDVNIDERSAGQIDGLPPGRYMKLTVKDTGHGIEPDKIDKIFDPYFTTKKVDKGTGLGLSVVHGIVAIYKGAINVKSDPGEGSVFTVYLPASEQKIETEETAEPVLPRGRESILFVDDETTIIKLMQLILSKLGYQVETFSSPMDALLAFKLNPDKYDLVITDMTMPDMTGDNLATALITIQPDIPVILCTGYSEKISAETAKKIGIREFLIKPVTKQKLSEAIRKVLDQN